MELFSFAPMSEVTTPPLRRLVRSFSPEVLLYSEMLSAAAIVSGGAQNDVRMARYDFDEPYVCQILGDDPRIMAEAARVLAEGGCRAVDINMGCSAPAILRRGWGAALLRNQERALRVVAACRRAVDVKLSVKMRSGYETSDPDSLTDFCRRLEGEGVDFIVLHPRNARIAFRRKADWSLVKTISGALSIPVIGNGDIESPPEAVRRLRETGCAGVMIGREAVKSPWIFRLCYDLHAKGIAELEVDAAAIFISMLEEMKEFLPPELRKSRMHRFAAYYIRNFRHSHEFFTRIRNENLIENCIDVVRDYFDRNPSEAVKSFRFLQEEIAGS